MALEPVGFDAIIRGVAQYAANAKRIVAANAGILTSTKQLRAPAGGFAGVAGGRFLSTAQSQQLATQKLGAAAAAAILPLTSLNARFQGLDNVLTNLPGKLAKTAYFLGRMQFVAISAVAALAGLGAPVIFAAKFEQTLATIAGLTNVPREAIAGLRDDILALSREVAKSPEELGAASYRILSSGISDAATATKILEFSAKAATAGLGQTQDVARTLTSIMNAYGLSADDAETITNQLVAAVREGSAEASDLAASIGRVIPIAAQMGVEFAQVASVLASMTNIGLSTERSVTGLIGIFSQLLKPAQRSRELFHALGIDITAFRREVDENFIGAMDRLFASFQGREDIVAELFPDLRGFIGALAAFGRERGGVTAEIFGRISTDVNALEIAFEAATNTVSFKFRKALNDVRLALTQVGQTLLPTFSRLFGGVSNFVERATEGARNFRREWGPTLREFAEGIRESLVVIRNFGRILLSAARAPGVSESLRILGATVKLVARNLDILLPALTAFAIFFIGGRIVAGIAAATAGLRTLAVVIGQAAVQGTFLRAVMASFSFTLPGIIASVALLAGGLVFGQRLFSRFSGGVDTSEKVLKELLDATRQFREVTLTLGLDERSSELAGLANEVENLSKGFEAATNFAAAARREVESLTRAPRVITGPTGFAEVEGIKEADKRLKTATQAADEFREKLKVIKEQFDEIKGTAARAQLAENLEKAKIPAETIANLLPDVAAGAEEAGFAGANAFKDFGDSLQTASDLTREHIDVINDLSNAFSGLRSELDAIAGTRSADEAQLEFEISQRELAISQIELEAGAHRNLTDAEENTIGVLNDEIGIRKTRIDVLRGEREVLVGLLETTQGLFPTQKDVLDLILAIGIQSEAGARTLDNLADAERDLRAEGNNLAADLAANLIKSLTTLNETHVKLQIDSLQVVDAQRKINDARRFWNQFAFEAQTPITLQISVSTFAKITDISKGLINKIQSFAKKVTDETSGRISKEAAASGQEKNPFEEFVKAEQIREIILRVANEGKATWADVARLWELGAHEAALDFARFMRGEVSMIGLSIEESFRAIAAKWMTEIERGILEGTVDVLDALHFLEQGMIDAARSIVEGLTAQADSMAERWQILIDILTAGTVTIQQVNRLFQIGAIDQALELLRFMSGRPSTLTGAIEGFRRQTSPFRGSFQHGGFVPAGPPMPAILHGPEVVVPLGNTTVLNALQRALSGFGGGSGGDFRNYGSVHVHASDRDSQLMRSMTRALGMI